jgi:hypothetical protein
MNGNDVKEYTIASAVGVDDLIKKVNSLMKKQWFPIGGIVGVSTTTGPALLQPLIRSVSPKGKRVAHA